MLTIGTLIDALVAARQILCLIVVAATGLVAPAACAQVHLWSQSFGDVSSDNGIAVAVDALGNVIVTGSFTGTVDFGGDSLMSAGDADIFVAKYDASGVHQWSRNFGGTAIDVGSGVCVDTSGNVIVTGSFGGTVDFGGGSLVSAGAWDVFLAKYDASGVHKWSLRFGAEGVESDQSGYAVAVDVSANVIVTGEFLDTVDFGGGPLMSAGNRDIFVAKYNANGEHQWSRHFGGASADRGQAVAMDASGSVIATGRFQGTVDFGGGPLMGAGNDDIFVARYDASGVHQFSRRFGDTGIDRGQAVAVDASGNAVVTGSFQGTVDFGGGNLMSAGDRDIFVATYDTSGAHKWSRNFGGTLQDLGAGLAVDAQGNSTVTGSFRNTVDFGGDPLMSAGSDDIFVATYDASGAHLWSWRFGGTLADLCNGVAVDALGNVILTGRFMGSLDFGGGPLMSAAGSLDVFVAKLGYQSTDVGGDDAVEFRLAIDASPNPSQRGTTLMLRASAARTIQALIVDPRGRVVRSFGIRHLDRGANALFWDGDDDAGLPVSAGVYFAVVRPNELTVPRKLVITR